MQHVPSAFTFSRYCLDFNKTLTPFHILASGAFYSPLALVKCSFPHFFHIKERFINMNVGVDFSVVARVQTKFCNASGSGSPLLWIRTESVWF